MVKFFVQGFADGKKPRVYIDRFFFSLEELVAEAPLVQF